MTDLDIRRRLIKDFHETLDKNDKERMKFVKLSPAAQLMTIMEFIDRAEELLKKTKEK